MVENPVQRTPSMVLLADEGSTRGAEWCMRGLLFRESMSRCVHI